MNVAELLEIDLLKPTGVRVLAGEEHLLREVRWVHTGEIADIARYLSGGEVLLTAATGLRSSEADHRRYIRELAEVGVAALILELGRGLRKVPRSMIEEAERGELILVTLDREVPFVAVTHFVHTQLISSAHEALLRAIEIEDALSQLILEGATLPAMLALLSERLNNPVILEDAAHRVVAFGRASGAFAPILRAWQAHSRSPHSASHAGVVNGADAEPPCAWRDIVLRGDRWGRLHVLEVDRPLDEVVRLALGRTAASIALHLMTERDAHMRDTAEHALVRGVAAQQDFSGQDFLDRAAGLGINLEGKLVMLAVAPDHAERTSVDQEHPVDRLVVALRDAMTAAKWPSIVGAFDEAVVAVASAEPAKQLAGRLAEVAAQLGQPPLEVRAVGVSRPCAASALPRALTEARAAQRLAPSEPGCQVQRYDELALHRLLAPLVPGPELANFVEDELGELIAYDAAHNADLVRTLDAYLQANGNKIATADILHLRRRSVYYRLDRIEQVVGHSVDSPDRRARLYVALRARELLRDRPMMIARR
jgi:purine catabolism regulator